ncbi:hypothetical protein DYB26_005766, partial [Aphanomyces astaci]
LPGSYHGDSVQARPGSDRSTSPAAVHRACTVLKTVEGPRPVRLRGGCSDDHKEGDNRWRTSGTAPGPTLNKEDVDMGQNEVHLHNAPVLPKNPTFKGSTKEERRVIMAAYNLYISQTNALTANGVRPFIMLVRACIEPTTKQRIAEWDMRKDPDDVSEGELIAWF